MAVKITNGNPRNGDQNVQVHNGQIVVTGTVDEPCTVSATLTDGVNPPIAGTPVSMFVNTNQQWSFTFPAAANTNYSLTVQGTNAGGTGSSTITFKTA
jgi:hypothetical protein